MNKKKTMLFSVAALMTISPVVPLAASSLPAQAATNQSKIGTLALPKKSNDYQFRVYTRNGKFTSFKKLTSGKAIKFYGQARYVKGAKKTYSDVGLGSQRIINGKRAISLGKGGYLDSKALGGSLTKGVTTIITLARNTTIMNQNGKQLSYWNGKRATYKKGAKIVINVPYYYAPMTLYNIGNGNYLKGSQLAELNGKGTLTLITNTYVYNREGQRVRSQGKLLNGQTINHEGSTVKATRNSKFVFYPKDGEANESTMTLKTTAIGGQPYFAIGKNKYVKAANVGYTDGHMLFDNGTVTATMTDDTYAYNSSFKQTKKIYRAGQKVQLDGYKIDNSLSDPQLYFHVKGTNYYLYVTDAGEYGDSGTVFGHDFVGFTTRTMLNIDNK